MGPQGPIGNTGTQGPIGYTGSTGTQGVQGITGYTGSTGTQGIRGFTGSTGTQGSRGFVGSTGTQGIPGYTGSRGAYDAIGFTGSAGEGAIRVEIMGMSTTSTVSTINFSTGTNAILIGNTLTVTAAAMGGYIGNFDGGRPDSNYGGITSINAGGVSG